MGDIGGRRLNFGAGYVLTNGAICDEFIEQHQHQSTIFNAQFNLHSFCANKVMHILVGVIKKCNKQLKQI